ncbi:unnamed protein product [Ectocarpus sp. 12 AP-2014]
MRRWFAAAYIGQSVNMSRLQEQVGDELVVNDSVFKMLNTLSGLKIKPFAARQVQIGNDKAKGVLVNDKFAALVKGLQGMVTLGASAVGKERAASFLAPFTDMRYVYTITCRSIALHSRGSMARRWRKTW